MPTYEYLCPKCDKEIERIVKIAESNKQKCDDCKTKLVLLMSAPNRPIFKSRRYLP